eukprot:TRINITY_DN9376_c0_g1_i1.p1 TRINITY_DN9376_c0_g1~~TRINITY_DN9376_c0_g1_i1.p1  ORF type:complete len:114 (+),score=22.22 TRINITY_DN9376_c0_g1_i1:427-768(+)
MLQVNTSGENSKSGIETPDCVELFEKIKNECPQLEIVGLMTIGSPDASHSEEENHDFVCLVNCRKQICEKLGLTTDQLELSMGMSSDFLKAIEYGSTNVRVGSSIFGARNYSK